MYKFLSLLVCFFYFSCFLLNSVICFMLVSFTYMSSLPSSYISYEYGASHHTWNIASTSWVFYTPTSELLSSSGIFLGHTTNNVVEYTTVIELLLEATSLKIPHLVIKLDSQMVVMNLNNHTHICNPIFLCKFLRVQLLERNLSLLFMNILQEHLIRYPIR